MSKNKTIKVVNNMPTGALGIETADGKRHVLRKPDSFKNITNDDIWHIYNTTKTIQKGYLFIDDKGMRIELGLEEDDSVDVNALSRQDLKNIIEQSSLTDLKDIFSSDLSNGTKEKIVILAREQYKESGMDARKLKLIEQETGMPVVEEDGTEIQEVNDIKEQKKVKKHKVETK